MNEELQEIIERDAEFLHYEKGMIGYIVLERLALKAKLLGVKEAYEKAG